MAKYSLVDIEPEIWRRVEVPLDMPLKGIHDVIQAAMGWQDYHMFEFRVGDKLYGLRYPDDDMFGRKIISAKTTKLSTLIARGVAEFEYVYDMGDDWQHRIVVEAVADADPNVGYPRFIDGARRCPPEDVGSVPGYYDFLKAVTNPRNRQHRQMLEWYGRPYDPNDIDLLTSRLRLGDIAKRRRAGKAAYAKRMRGS